MMRQALLASFVLAVALAVACSVVNQVNDDPPPSHSTTISSSSGGSAGTGGQDAGAGQAGEAGTGGIPATCGNGDPDVGEACDDGNTQDCDGCRGDCSAVETGCGDGFACGDEECDDGGASDVCDGDCTLALCGDNTYNLLADEQCDDGNLQNFDGCNSNCNIEGTCISPEVILLSGNPLTGSVTRKTGGQSQVVAAPCDGHSAGAGSDRIYSFTLNPASPVTISVTGDFDVVLRAMSVPCSLASALLETGPQPDGCSDSGVPPGDETLNYNSLSGYVYFVV